MNPSDQFARPRRRHRRSRRRQYIDPYPLWTFVKYYCYAWAFTALSGLGGPLIILGYFIAGYALNRAILTRVEWHKYTVTLADVASTKFWALLLWPVVYPVFFVQIFIAKFL